MQILSWGVGRGGQEYKETNLKSSNAQEGGTLKLGIDQHIMIDQ